METDWTLEACCSRAWTASVLLIALGLMGIGVAAAGWGLLRLDVQATPTVIMATMSGTVAIFVFGAAALIAFADLVRPREPVVVIDAYGVLDTRIAPCIIPWAAIRRARRGRYGLALDVDPVDDFAPPPSSLPARWLRRPRGAITISSRGLACAGSDLVKAVERGLQAHAGVAPA